MGCNRVFDRVLPGHTRFYLFQFFLQPSPVPVPDQPAGRTGFYLFLFFLNPVHFQSQVNLPDELDFKTVI